jgi:DNA polymerase III alpha subunit
VKIDQYGQVSVTEQEAFTALYSGKISSLDNLFVEDCGAILGFNQARLSNADAFGSLQSLPELNISKEEFDQLNQQHWFMPESYQTLDIAQWLLDQCSQSQQIARVEKELELFTRQDMIPVLQYLKYLVDVMRENNILWGVGRGSSVASYCLYLIGVHRIDSIRYDLPIEEFLK